LWTYAKKRGIPLDVVELNLSGLERGFGGILLWWSRIYGEFDRLLGKICRCLELIFREVVIGVIHCLLVLKL